MLPYKVMSVSRHNWIKINIPFTARTFSTALGLAFLTTAFACIGGEAALSPIEDLSPIPSPGTTSPPTQVNSTPTPMRASTDTPGLSASRLPSPTEAVPIFQAPVFNLCSPLEGVAVSELDENISNPFYPPRLGSDEPHHGVDFAQLGPDRIALAGLEVQAAMAGRVAGIIQDRFPYGNAVILETPLDDLPAELRSLVPDAAPVPDFTAPLTCPPLEIDFEWVENQRSLYLLYAHLRETPSVQPGDHVTCGETIGVIGDSGNALNPHLHLEMRTGPASASLPSMSHYDPSASLEEMSVYCVWRISGHFQMFDPMTFFMVWNE
jgi:murein DD-endopeptidase MepM/ murein hydrolase activator NlpD